jgi:hypothetical protein
MAQLLKIPREVEKVLGTEARLDNRIISEWR